MRDFQSPGRSAVHAIQGMCAASHPLVAQVAVRLMQAGGNAVDAAIGAAAVAGLAEPQMCGLGGDCFVLLRPGGEERLIGLNGSGRAPAALDAAVLRGAGHETMPERGADTVTVPGAVDAFVRLSADWGRLGLDACLAPAIDYAEAGVPVAPRVAWDWALAAPVLNGDARRHCLIDGAAPRAGQVFRAPGQGEVLRRIARDGRAGFYAGEVAGDMVASLRAAGGCHSLDDFAAAASDYVQPVRGRYRGHELVELPPNGQGATAILMAQILERIELAGLDPLGAKRAHLEAEAAKFAMDARDRFIGDPAGSGARLGHLLSEHTATMLAACIDPKRAAADPAAAAGAVHRDTICLACVDRDRMAVSLIYSTFHAFGSGLASERFGINFHNRGAGFNLSPGHVNEAGGGRRPMHTIIPAMLRREGRLVMPFGVMGGPYQPTGHVRLISNLLDFGMELQQAIDAPRCFAAPGGLQLETGYDPVVAEELARLGHRVAWCDRPLGGAQAIGIDEQAGVLIGASDPRKDGCALGY